MILRIILKIYFTYFPKILTFYSADFSKILKIYTAYR